MAKPQPNLCMGRLDASPGATELERFFETGNFGISGRPDSAMQATIFGRNKDGESICPLRPSGGPLALRARLAPCLAVHGEVIHLAKSTQTRPQSGPTTAGGDLLTPPDDLPRRSEPCGG